MKTEELFKLVSDTINTMSIGFASIVSELTQKMMLADGENVLPDGTVLVEDDGEEIDDETYDKLSKIETSMFNSFGNLLKAKEALGEELDFGETMLKMQYESEMAEAMEMYREFKNTEEILNENGDKEE